MKEKTIKKIDSILLPFRRVSIMFIGFLLILVYVELATPHFGWARWFIDPIFFMCLLYLMWSHLYKNLFIVISKVDSFKEDYAKIQKKYNLPSIKEPEKIKQLMIKKNKSSKEKEVAKELNKRSEERRGGT